MNILEFYYNEDNRILYVEFSTKEDGDSFYRILTLNFGQIQYYSPEIVYEEDLLEIEESLIIEIITEYLKENDLPEEVSL